MRAGQLRHRVAIERAGESQGTTGELTATWSQIAIRRASIEPLSGRERFDAQQVNPEVSHAITLRYERDLLTPRDRIKGLDNPYSGAVFGVESVLNADGRSRQFTVLAREER